MNTEYQERLKQSVNDIAEILYRNTPSEQVTTLEGIEAAAAINCRRWARFSASRNSC